MKLFTHSFFKRPLNYLVKNRNKLDTFSLGKKTIVICGMRHAGSTALFNIIRLALEQKNIKYISCYSESEKYKNDFEEIINFDGVKLIKTHEFRDDIMDLADVIFTARRDLRDTVASALRRDFPLLKKVGGEVEYAKYNRALYDLWQPYSNYEFIYENFINNPLKSINNMVDYIDLKEVDCQSVLDSVNNLPTNNYSVTLLSESHITDPTHKLTYKDSLSLGVIDNINKNNFRWLKAHNYN